MSVKRNWSKVNSFAVREYMHARTSGRSRTRAQFTKKSSSFQDSGVSKCWSEHVCTCVCIVSLGRLNYLQEQSHKCLRGRLLLHSSFLTVSTSPAVRSEMWKHVGRHFPGLGPMVHDCLTDTVSLIWLPTLRMPDIRTDYMLSSIVLRNTRSTYAHTKCVLACPASI